jgi:uncharacterized protein
MSTRQSLSFSEQFKLPDGKLGCTVLLKLVGNKCNMACAYCYEQDKGKGALQILPVSHVAELIDCLLHLPRIRFVMHGGEPLLYPKFLMREVLAVIAERLPGRHTIQLQTNGTLIDDEWISIFSNVAAEVAISVSLDPPNHEQLRSLPGKDLNQLLMGKLKLILDTCDSVGVVSVAHRGNVDGFRDFLEQLIGIGVRYLTVNRIRQNQNNSARTNRYFLDEVQFALFLEKLICYWIQGRLFHKIQIQPLMSLLSAQANQRCEYIASPEKCRAFITLYPDGTVTNCDHLLGEVSVISDQCHTCSIYSWCGAGCLGESRNAGFCRARRHLKSYIDTIVL